MTSQRQTLRVAMVDDEAPLSAAVKRILAKYKGHVEAVDVDVTYASTHFSTVSASPGGTPNQCSWSAAKFTPLYPR